MNDLEKNSNEIWQARLISRGPTPASYKQVDLTKAYPNEEAETRDAWVRGAAKLSMSKETLRFTNDRVLLKTRISLEANPGNVLKRAVATKSSVKKSS